MSMLTAKLIALIAGLAVVATAAPADAAKKQKHTKHKTVVAARSSTVAGRRGTDKFRSGPLYYNGNEYLGDDPDPNIRFQLWRDLGAHFGSPE